MNSCQTQPLIDTMRDAGVMPCAMPELTPGDVSRFRIEGDKSGSLNGWIYPFPDGAGCVFGSWKTGVSAFHFADGIQVNSIERKRVMMEARQAMGEAQRKAEVAAAIECRAKLSSATPASNNHPYLVRKSVKAHRIYQSGDWLLIPIHDQYGGTQSLQFIMPDGTKRFKSGGLLKGGRYWLGGHLINDGTVFIAEGYATAATVREVTGCPVCVAFTAGNLREVTESVRCEFPRSRIIIAADNDANTDGNPGLSKALDAARRYRAEILIPSTNGDWNDHKDELAEQWKVMA